METEKDASVCTCDSSVADATRPCEPRSLPTQLVQEGECRAPDACERVGAIHTRGDTPLPRFARRKRCRAESLQGLCLVVLIGEGE
jgi:hypothetical protein